MFPKKGKVFPRPAFNDGNSVAYADAIAAALQKELGDSHQAVKTAMRWTGANERTVKNWLAGSNGPSGHHLLSLVYHSDAVFEEFLRLSGRPQSAGMEKLIAARQALSDLLEIVSVAVDPGPYPSS